MIFSFSSFLLGVLLVLVQLVAAIPWVMVAFLSDQDRRLLFRNPLKSPFLRQALIVTLVCQIIPAVLAILVQERESLEIAGRTYAAILQIQLTLDLFIFGFLLVLWLWPKGGAVALAAFREGVRQWMFWLLTILAAVMMMVSVFVPYFTFGEDYLVVKQLGYDTIMLAAVLFGTLAASISISEEIEGRTAVTLMSKPVSRRQFLLGKYLGILLAALFMFGLLAVHFEGVLLVKHWWEKLTPLGEVTESTAKEAARIGVVPTPAWVLATLGSLNFSAQPTDFLRGIGQWLAHTADTLPALVLYFSQVMVLVALAVALATRVPMVVNLVTVLCIYFMAHLTPVLSTIAGRARENNPNSPVPRLIGFVTQLLDTILPDLASFKLDPALLSDAPPPPVQFAQYVSSVTFYGILYTIIVLIFGLILFEDRDVA